MKLDNALPSRSRLSRSAQVIGILYVIFLHLLIAIFLVKTDFMVRAGKTLGWLPPAERSVEFYQALIATAGRGTDIRPDETVILGDSIMAGLGARAFEPHIRNLALGGMTTHTLRELLPFLPGLARAHGAIIGIGVNDLKYRPPEIIARDFTDLLGLLPVNLPLVLVAILPVDERNAEIRTRKYLRNNQIAALNARIEPLCHARPLCRYLDNTQAMTDAAGNLRGQYHIGDGWHLSPAGNLILMEKLHLAAAQWPVPPAVAPRPVR